jgi:hypothetical protein
VTSGIFHSNHTKKPPIRAIVGGILSGIALLVFILGVILYIRRRRHRVTDTLGGEQDVSPFTTPGPNPGIIGNSRAQGPVGGLQTGTAGTMSKSRLRTGIRHMQPGMGIGNRYQPQLASDANGIMSKSMIHVENQNMQPGMETDDVHQPPDDIERNHVRDSLPPALLVQIGDFIREELAVALGSQARPLREARQGPASTIVDEPPPKYVLETGGGRGG